MGIIIHEYSVATVKMYLSFVVKAACLLSLARLSTCSSTDALFRVAGWSESSFSSQFTVLCPWASRLGQVNQMAWVKPCLYFLAIGS